MLGCQQPYIGNINNVKIWFGSKNFEFVGDFRNLGINGNVKLRLKQLRRSHSKNMLDYRDSEHNNYS